MIDLGLISVSQQLFDRKYELRKKLGGGGFSEVWLAYDTISRNEFALKVYSQSVGLDEEGEQMFREEFSRVCNLNHTNILRPFSYDIAGGSHPYLVLPYCSKGSCAGMVGKMTEEEMRNFIHDVADGLSYLHNLPKPMIHQDIKPANILIDNLGKYVITDFGISTNLHRTLTRRSMPASNEGSGTTAYMAPERFGTKTTAIIANDIWSLGATLYELATGDVPFGEFGGLTQSKVHRPAPIEGDYSEDIKNLIYACLSEEPWERPSADDILNRQITSPPKRSKKRYIIGAVATLGIVACGMIGYNHYREESIKEEMAHIMNLQNDRARTLINKADSIMEVQNNRSQGGIDYERIKEKDYVEAFDLYTNASNLIINDSLASVLNKKKKTSFEDMRQAYLFFKEKEDYYRAMSATEAAKQFERRRLVMEAIISDNKLMIDNEIK